MHSHTVGATPRRTTTTDKKGETTITEVETTSPLPNFGPKGKPYPPDVPAEREAYVVDFEGPDDPLHPMNLAVRRKIIYGAIGALACFCSTFASSVLSAATREIAAHFGIGIEVASLSSALYLVGYGVGPAVWGPLSELKGRKMPLVVGSFGFSVFAVGVAVAKDIQTLMICRFFMGVFGSCPLVVVAAMYTDIFPAETRGLALTIFAASVFVGPMVGPVVGSFTVTSHLGWRWDGYWSAIMGFTTMTLLVLVYKETYPPAVLVSKAEYLRRRTKNWAIHAKQEEIEIDLKEMLSKNLSRPLRMFFTEPILLAIGVYLSFVYGLLYICLSAYPLVFQGVHHWRPGVGSLPFLGMMLGILSAGAASIAMNPWWVRKYHAAGNRALPEWRLPLVGVGSIAFTIGIFWFGWTGAFESVHWIVPVIGGYVLGFGILAIFMMLIMYIVDAYLML